MKKSSKVSNIYILVFRPMKVDTVDGDYSVSSGEPNQRLGRPSSFDYRNEGIVTPAKFQGNCGSCWAFTAAAMAESKLIKDKRYPKSVDLSEMYLLKCTPRSNCNSGYLWEATIEARKMTT